MKTYYLIALLLFFPLLIFSQQVKYVSTNGNGLMNGSNWNNALNNSLFISQLKHANYGDTFYLAEGVYKTENNRDSSFTIRAGVKLFGGFATDGNPGLEQRNPNFYLTVFNADLNLNDMPGLVSENLNIHPTKLDNNINLIIAENADSNTLIDGFVLKNAKNQAIYIKSGVLNINNCRLMHAGNFALYIQQEGSVKVNNCTIDSNQFAMFTKGTFVVNNCAILNNTSAFVNGAVKIENIDGTFNNTNFGNNKSVLGSASGGAVNASNSTISFNNCLFSGNYANYSGGAINSNNGLLNFYKCTFLGNFSNNGSAINSNTKILADSCVFYSHIGNYLIKSSDSLNFVNSNFTGGTGIIQAPYSIFLKCNFTSVTNGFLTNRNGVIDSCLFERCGNIIASGGVVKNSIFRNNIGISVYNSTLISGCLFERNYGTSIVGSGLGNMTVERCNFNATHQGIKIQDFGPGAQFYNIKNCIFDSCYSDNPGAAISFSSNQIKINSCGFFNNISKSFAGALFCQGAANISNSVFANNKAKSAAVAFFDYKYIPPFIGSILQSTFYGNQSDTGSAGIIIASNLVQPIITIQNNIWWQNTTNENIYHLDVGNSSGIVSNNCIQTQSKPLSFNFNQYNNYSYYPLFVNTNLLKGFDGVYGTQDDGLALHSCSKAINDGDSSLAISDNTIDFTGFKRIVGSNLDLGAYEKQTDTLINVVPYNLTFSLLNNSLCKDKVLNFKTHSVPFQNFIPYAWYKNGLSINITNDTILNLDARNFENGDTVKCKFEIAERCLSAAYDSSKFIIIELFNLPDSISIEGKIKSINGSIEKYSVKYEINTNYNWKAFGGNIISKIDTNIIEVLWDTQSVIGKIFVEVTNKTGCTAKDSISVDILNTFISKVDLNNLRINLYPNPANSFIKFIDPTDAMHYLKSIEFFNIKGQLVFTLSSHSDKVMNEYPIDLLPGIYFVNLTFNNDFYAKPIKLLIN